MQKKKKEMKMTIWKNKTKKKIYNGAIRLNFFVCLLEFDYFSKKKTSTRTIWSFMNNFLFQRKRDIDAHIISYDFDVGEKHWNKWWVWEFPTNRKINFYKCKTKSKQNIKVSDVMWWKINDRKRIESQTNKQTTKKFISIIIIT